jgi:glutamate decarboxylase
MIGKLFNAPEEPNPNADGHYSTCLGVSTIGSSEAIILGVLSAKRRWQIKRRAEGKSTEKPNLVSCLKMVCVLSRSDTRGFIRS